MKLTVLLFSLIAFSFLFANPLQAQQCTSGFSCLDVEDSTCNSMGGTISPCNSSDFYIGNCCAPHRSCLDGLSCLSLSKNECQDTGGFYGSCYTGDEAGTCCDPAINCIQTDTCFSLSRQNCEDSAGVYGSCWADSGTGNCCVKEQYCSFPTVCLKATPYDCTETWNGTIGACTVTLWKGNCCAFTGGPPKPKGGKPPPLFCVDDDPNYKTSIPDSGKIATAIGCIPINDNRKLTEFFIGWGIGLGGGIAFLLIVYAGFMIMTSGGDPKKITAGKELLTSAIAGLLLIILGAYLLRLVGVDILGLF